MLEFKQPHLIRHLEECDDALFDGLGFGVVGLAADRTVIAYNRFESKLSGLSRERVVGRHFFTEVAPCTNNYLVAQRYEDAETLDEVVPYVFTLKMRPTPVELRLLRAPGAQRMYLLVHRS